MSRAALHALMHFWIAALGYRERHDGMGMTYDGDPESPRSQAYDFGRALGNIGRAL